MNKYDKNIGYANNSLTCISHAGLDTKSPSMSKYIFKCTCGSTRTVRFSHVSSGQVKACDYCGMEPVRQQRSSEITHGETGTPLYKCWNNMLMRVKSNDKYKTIEVCDKWHNYLGFKEDIGDTYFEGARLDRIDNLKGYNKDNCQWLSLSEHATKSAGERYEGRTLRSI